MMEMEWVIAMVRIIPGGIIKKFDDVAFPVSINLKIGGWR